MMTCPRCGCTVPPTPGCLTGKLCGPCFGRVVEEGKMAKGKSPGLTVSLKLYGKDGKKLSHSELELKPGVTQEEALRLYEEILATVTTKAAVMSQTVGGA